MGRDKHNVYSACLMCVALNSTFLIPVRSFSGLMLRIHVFLLFSVCLLLSCRVGKLIQLELVRVSC